MYAGLNVFGLAAGAMCVLLALLFVQDELSYDRFHRDGPRLYRVTTDTDTGDGSVTTSGGTGMVQGPAFKAQIPEIEYFRPIRGLHGKEAVAVPYGEMFHGSNLKNNWSRRAASE